MPKFLMGRIGKMNPKENIQVMEDVRGCAVRG